MQPAAASGRTWTFIGLAIALFGGPAVVLIYRLVAEDPTATGNVVLRELVILALVAVLLWIVLTRERLPLSSIGIDGSHIGRSLAWGLVAMVMIIVGLAACLLLYQALGIRYGEGGGAIAASTWAVLLTVVRAGVAEEIFYRGFALERLEMLTGSRWLAAGITLICFAAVHYRQGLPGMFIALVLGAILTGFYLWKRDLIAAIFAHFLVDFIPNVLLPLLGAE